MGGGRPKDIGIQTEIVLGGGLPWDLAAAVHFQTEGRAAGNGALMRAVTGAVWFAPQGRAATMAAARRITALTHGDGAAWEGTAILHELLRVALEGGDPPAAVPRTLAAVRSEHRERWARVLAPDWRPELATESNGAVWACLGSALWALRVTGGFPDALRAVIDLGGDTDTTAAVTGGLAGAVYGADAIRAPGWSRCTCRCPRPGGCCGRGSWRRSRWPWTQAGGHRPGAGGRRVRGR